MAQLGQQPATRSPWAAFRGFDVRGASLAILRRRSEREPEVPDLGVSGSQALVVPVQTAGLADLNDLADLRRLYSPGLRAVHR